VSVPIELFLHFQINKLQLQFSYNKTQVIQALRLHFISKTDIKVMMIIVNVFAIVSAVFFYMKKIRPEPFFIGTLIWVLMLISVWYILPYAIYNKSTTFKDEFNVFINDEELSLHTHKGYVVWNWNTFNKWMESRYFFYLYFDNKTFFLIPKEVMNKEMEMEMRKILKKEIKNGH
jgi:hypothetical protein